MTDHPPALERAVWACLDAHLRGASAVVIGVSGGPDSLALMDLCARWPERGLTSLIVAHLDHGWRSSSAADAEYVQSQASERGLRCVVERAVDLRESEQSGRAARDGLFGRVASEFGAPIVLLGHTADDQIETVLFNLCRGAGVDGAGGMDVRTQRELGGHACTIVRPLLPFSRSTIEAYCRARSLTPLLDPSNTSPRFARNRVRHEILPAIERVFPAARAALRRFAAVARDQAAIDAHLAEILLSQARIGASATSVELSRPCLRSWPQPSVRVLLHHVLGEMPGGRGDLTFERVDALCRAIGGKRRALVLELPLGRIARIQGEVVALEHVGFVAS
jgi:tRNA(Ile)-lysidine synthase